MKTSFRFRFASLVVGGAFLVSLSAHAACPRPGLFDPMSLYDMGVFAVSIVVADFNEDGVPDMAVTNYSDNNVSIRRGLGDGTFGPAITPPAGSGPRGIASGDFNEDGILDLAVTNVGAPTVQILLGQGAGGVGNGTFGPPTPFAAGAENRGVVAADLNEDGILDLAIAGRTSVAILIGNGAGGVGNGKFAAPVNYATPSSWGLTVADYTGDGILDIAAGNWLNSSVSMWIGNGAGGVGNGTFHAGTTVITPGGNAEITTGDVDANGIPDLVAAGSTGIWVMKGNGAGGLGDGTFTVSPFFFGTQANDVVVADLDGDGFSDIASTDTGLNRTRVMFGDGTGAFPDFQLYEAANGPNGIECADLNNDGRLDLLAVNSASLGFPGAVSVLLNACGSGTPEPHIHAVTDVPHDQGGKVFVTWGRSALDREQDQIITGYRVWRRVPVPGAAARMATSFASFRPSTDAGVVRSTGATVEYWEPLATLPAAFLEGYGYTAPTTQDSTADGNPYTSFFVQALTPDPFVFYSSAPDSGYSVDNLAPPAPAPFVAVYQAAGTALHWGRSTAPDFATFRLHRGTSAAFMPGPDNLVTAQPDTGYMDSPGTALFHYKLAAVDVHGNVGTYALVVPPGSATGVPDDVDDAVRIPNPVLAGDVTVSMRAAAGQPVRLELVDVSGRRMASVDAMGQGERMTLRLARAGALAPGLYFVRFEQPSLPSRRVAIVR